jgi:hypothetical protein
LPGQLGDPLLELAAFEALHLTGGGREYLNKDFKGLPCERRLGALLVVGLVFFRRHLTHIHCTRDPRGPLAFRALRTQCGGKIERLRA